MNIVLTSSEVEPFAKSGGLADVCAALPIEIDNLGHHVSVFMPGYRSIQSSECEITATGHRLEVPVGPKIVYGTLAKGKLRNSNVPVYFIQQDEYFDRDGLYGQNGVDYSDNCQRYVFFCRAVLESIRLLKLQVDLIHCNDWHSGLIPALISTEHYRSPILKNVATLFTIHNLAYQGIFPKLQMENTGIDWKYFNWKEMEFFGQLNLLKTGIVFADAINTVSPTYAREIQTDEQGCGLQSVLQHRRDRLTGIPNGIDPVVWNPKSDPFIERQYNTNNWQEGKAICKSALQSQLGLDLDPNVPLIGIVGRLEVQKGWPLILDVMQNKMEHIHAQWVVLGTGQPEFHVALKKLAKRYPKQLAASLIFSNQLAHQIEAGADMFLMPSQFEPCGLNQLYSLAYGTIPIVHKTGGLADTVVDASPENIRLERANGFGFDQFSTGALVAALSRAVQMFNENPKIWERMVLNGMTADWTWTKSAHQYIALYLQAIEYHKAEKDIKL